MGYIPNHALQNLKQYQYKGVDKSILSKYVLNPYWNRLVKLWPKSVAPNTITLTGLSLVFINFLTLLYYDPHYLTAKHGVEMPNWIYFTWAAGLFMYQSLDAIDGLGVDAFGIQCQPADERDRKQARRTQMSGPLGEMFDHGCDAINTTLGAILTCYALNLGCSWWTIASQVASLANFYLTTWEEYHTGQLYLGVFSGPVEGILMIVVLFIITGFYGPAFWDQGFLSFLHLGSPTSILPDVPLNVIFMYFGGVGLAFNIFTSYRNVHHHFLLSSSSSSSSSSKPPPSSFTPRGSQSSLIRPTLRLLPFPLAVSLQLLWLSAPTPDQSTILYSPLLVPFMCAWGFQFAHQVGRMILAHLTKRKDMPFWEWMWIWTALCVVDANAETALGRSPIIQTTYTRTMLLVLTTLLLSFLTYARFVYLVINDITNFLGIACFTVRKKDSAGVWRSSIPESPTMEVNAQMNVNINAKGKVE